MSTFNGTPYPLRPLSEVCQKKEKAEPHKSPDAPFRYVDLSSVDNETHRIMGCQDLIGADAPSRARKRIREGDTLFATTRPYLRGIAQVPEAYDGDVCSTGFCVLRPNREEIDPDWLFFATLTSELMAQITPKMRGATYPAVSDKDVLASEIPVPPLDEQRRLVARIRACLDRVDAVRQLRQESTEASGLVFPAVIEETLADLAGEEVTLGDVASIDVPLVDPTEPEYRDLPYVGGANIVSETGELIDLESAAEAGQTSGKYPFGPGHVLYSKIRPYLKKVARPDFEGVCSADMYPLSTDPSRLDTGYLFYLLLSRDFTEYAVAVSNRAGMPKVNRKQLFGYTFSLPPLDAQRKAVQALDRASEASRLLLQHQREQAEQEAALTQSVLARAFAGEL